MVKTIKKCCKKYKKQKAAFCAMCGRPLKKIPFKVFDVNGRFMFTQH